MTSQGTLDKYFCQSKRKREGTSTKRRKISANVAEHEFLSRNATPLLTIPVHPGHKDKASSADAQTNTVKNSDLHKINASESGTQAKLGPKLESPKKQPILANSGGNAPTINKIKQTSPQIQTEAKALDVASVKDRLAKCGKLAELQQRLTNLRECAETAKRVKKTKKGEAQQLVKKVVDETKSETKPQSIPAYQRFHYLASSDAATGLILPYKHKLLLEVFRSVDTVVAMLYNRQELCTFSKLKPAVQEMLRKTLEMRHLAQVKHAYPEAYIFGMTMVKNNSQDITVTPNITSDLVDNAPNKVTAVDDNGNFGEPREANRMPPRLMLHRINTLQNRLLEIVKQHHDIFLKSLTPPINLAKDAITKWHPRFRVDEVPDLEQAELPRLETSNKHMTAIEVFHKVKGLYGPKIENALKIVSEKMETKVTHEDAPAPQRINANLKGIPLSLLQKIRAKEAEKLKREMTRDAATDRKIAMTSRLEELARILRVYFISERKVAIIIDDVIQKLVDSVHSALPQGEIRDHIALLAEMAPEFISLIVMRNVEYVKINKHVDLNTVIEKISREQNSLT